MGGSPSTRKRRGGQGPNEARVMTGGGFIHLLVEKEPRDPLLVKPSKVTKLADYARAELRPGKIDKMNRTKLPIRKRIGNVPQFPGSVDAAVVEIVDPIERPNKGPDDVHIEDVAVEDVVLERIIAEEDLVKDPNKTEEVIAKELMTIVRVTTRDRIGVYYHMFVQVCKDSSPFNAATCKTEKFEWTEKCENIF
ncbi:hypothetical protein AgCh_033926 [Apium graveolens]